MFDFISYNKYLYINCHFFNMSKMTAIFSTGTYVVGGECGSSVDQLLVGIGFTLHVEVEYGGPTAWSPVVAAMYLGMCYRSYTN